MVEEKLRATRDRLEQTTERLAQAAAATKRLEQARREDGKRYKARLAELESGQERRLARAGETAGQAARRIAALEQELRTRDAALAAAAREESLLEQRVTAAMQELEAARESLAAIDVKLDILEGAANVLDRRTRAARSPERDDPR